MEKTYVHEGEPIEVGKLLKQKFKFSRRMITSLKKTNGIAVNSNAVFSNFVVQSDDTVTVTLPDLTSDNILPEKGDLEVVYEDDFLLAVNKPKGIPVHPTLNFKSGTLANFVMYYFKGAPFVFRPVNRLDKDTSGLVLIAKDKNTAFQLSKQLKNGEIRKIYRATVVGTPPESGTVDAPIARCTDSIIKRCISPDGKPSETVFRTLSAENGLSVVEAEPVTGRTHQIRVHFAHIGHPLYADFLYGEEIPGKTFRLHCHTLIFTHPETGKTLKIEC
ncbi:MAG: RluA family pseudouridine synthase [Clostridia bacterium]|nr:RluA family pseudouridine synthase [Clostridia bacterium]